MLISALEKEKKEIFKQGEIEGDIKRQTETARKMIAKGFDLALIAELTDLSEEAILQLKQEMQN